MTDKQRHSPKVREYLRQLGNPYASLQIVDEVELADTQPAKQAQERKSEGQGKTVGPTVASDLGKYHNPYAFVDDDEAVSPPSTLETLTKSEFESRCRAILSQYMPAIEKGYLRPHYRAFIATNANRSPMGRFQIWKRLSRYDLSNVTGLRVQFNREREEITEEKLRAIGRAADSEDET